MRMAAVVSVVLAAPIFGQAPVVSRATVWVDTVKRGDMPVSVRGRGAIRSNKAVELEIPVTLAEQVQAGQVVSVNMQPALLSGRVSRVGASETNGTVAIGVDLEGTLPESARAGAAVDGTIHIATLKSVTYVGRPVSCRPNSEGTLFKVEPGGQTATRVKVRYGRFGHTPAAVVEIRQGLEPGDHVILSDMSAHVGLERVRLE